MARKWKIGNQRGDTLIEVTLALAILAIVLLSATATATRAYLLGFNAVERTRLASEAQNQMESVRAFRDNHSWDEFLNGSGVLYQGVESSLSSPCIVTTPCMHMILTSGAIREYVPTGGKTSGSVPTSYIEITVTPGPGATPLYVDVNLSYGFAPRGGGTESINHIKTRFTDLGFAVATPPPPPPPFVSCLNSNNDIEFVLDASDSMDVPFGTGFTRATKLVQVVRQFIPAVVTPAGNHLGIVQFNSSPQTLSQLSSSVPALQAAIGNYNQALGTNITLGLVTAHTELLSPRGRPGSPNIVVLVSDGVPVGDTEASVEAQARVLGLRGTVIYVIQMGNAPGAEAFLRRVVADGAPGGTYARPADATEMDAVIAGIQALVTCP